MSKRRAGLGKLAPGVWTLPHGTRAIFIYNGNCAVRLFGRYLAVQTVVFFLPIQRDFAKR
jgi:hypothetical protein